MTAPIARREFLTSSAALLGAAWAASRGLAGTPADPFGGFTVGVQSYTFRKFDLEGCLKRTQELGLKFTEFYPGHIPADSNADRLAGIKKLLAEYGVAPIAIGVMAFSKNTDSNKKTFEFAAKLGAKFISADPSPDSFDSLDKLVAEYKIAVAIHPHGPTGKGKELHRWSSAEVILKAVKDHDPLIGTCLDTGHLIRTAQVAEPLDSAQQVRVMGARNFGLHLKDHDNKRKTDVPYGDPAGVLDVASVIKALKEVKFGGYISIEYEANESNPSPDVKKCVEYFQATVKKLA